MKKTLLTGLAAIAAMGLSCAKDMSVYNPQPEVIGQSETETIYKQVSWDREHIELSVLTTENGPDVYVFSHDPAVIEAETQEFRNDEFDAYMQTITSNFNIEQMVEDWHRAKGL